jgi:hypothetical protein
LSTQPGAPRYVSVNHFDRQLSYAEEHAGRTMATTGPEALPGPTVTERTKSVADGIDYDIPDEADLEREMLGDEEMERCLETLAAHGLHLPPDTTIDNLAERICLVDHQLRRSGNGRSQEEAGDQLARMAGAKQPEGKSGGADALRPVLMSTTGGKQLSTTFEIWKSPAELAGDHLAHLAGGKRYKPVKKTPKQWWDLDTGAIRD